VRFEMPQRAVLDRRLFGASEEAFENGSRLRLLRSRDPGGEDDG
jgi:hypothetical protein